MFVVDIPAGTSMLDHLNAVLARHAIGTAALTAIGAVGGATLSNMNLYDASDDQSADHPGPREFAALGEVVGGRAHFHALIGDPDHRARFGHLVAPNHTPTSSSESTSFQCCHWGEPGRDAA